MDAISTYMTFLMLGSTASTPTYSKLVDIQTTPDMGGDPDMLETTTMSDRAKTYIPGLINTPEGLQFETNYNAAAYQELEALRNTKRHYSVWLGGTENADGTVTPTGTNGKFDFDGRLSVALLGGETNAVQKMRITIAPESQIVPNFPS